MPLPKFPVRSIHGKHPTLGGLGDFPKNEATDSSEWQGADQKKALKPPVATFVLGPGMILRGEDGEIDGAVSQQTGKKKCEAFIDFGLIFIFLDLSRRFGQAPSDAKALADKPRRCEIPSLAC